jgi:hypothetical protein
MKVAGKLVPERFSRSETTPPGTILTAPREFVTGGDVSQEALEYFHLSADAS